MSCSPLAVPSVFDTADGVNMDVLFDVSLDLMVVRELAGPVVRASASWFTTLGYRPQEMVGIILTSLIHHDDLAVTYFSIEEVTNRKAGDPVLGQVNRYRHKDGHYVTLEWRAQRFGDHIFGVARDVTEKVAAEKALVLAKAAAEAASRAKSDFLANMSHEIRTPLNGVIGIVDALSRTPLDPQQTEMVALIGSSGATLERLVSDILDVSKIEAGRLSLENRAFDLDEALTAPLNVMRLRAQDKELAFHVERDEAAQGLFIGDSTRIRQILTNLLANAVKFTAQGAVTTRISLGSAGDEHTELMLEIQDTGIGFDSDHAVHLFDRFSQADAGITRRFGGTGLGLSICRSLTEMMGGRIEAASTPGAGSRFSVRLPLARAVPLADYEARDIAGPGPAPLLQRPLKVLLAEDHPTNQRVVQLILAGPGVDLTIVENGAQAIAAFRASRFDVVLMDMQMPVMDGLTATREIRRVEAARRADVRTPVIVLSANAMSEHRDQAMTAGADLHVPKPITAATLLAGLEAVTGG